jgi:sortase A
MSRREAIKFVILRSIGNFFVLFALYGVIATFGPALYYEIQFKIIQTRGIHYTLSGSQTSPLGEILAEEERISQAPSFQSILTGPTEQIIKPVDTQFSIVIPKIGASAKVFPNVDSSDKNDFLPILRQGVAHAQGTVFPGIPGNIYLFAHSTDNFWDVGRYNAIFYLIKDLSPGDEIVIFYQNVRYNYIVDHSEIVDADDVSRITEAKTGKEELVLQTCWPPGTTWKRLLVIAKRK